jgi:hypothetical protein
MKVKTLKQRKLKHSRKTRRVRGGFWSRTAKVAPLPSPEKRKIESQFDIFINKFNGSIADETSKSSANDMLAYYESQPEYKRDVDTDLKYPYSGKKLLITYKEVEQYSLKHDFSMCDIEALCGYIANKRLGSLNDMRLKEVLSNGALYIIKTILEKIGTDVTTDSVKRFMLQYIWNDTPIVKKNLDDSVNKFNQIRYTGGSDQLKKQLRNTIQANQAVLTGMLCVRVLIRKKFNEIGYSDPDLNDVFGGIDASLFNGPKTMATPGKTPAKMPPAPPGFIRRCIDGMCSLFRIKR